jgi:hypothetical protein
MFVKNQVMKKVFLFAVIGLFSCQKSIVKPTVRLSSQVSFRASYINEKFDQGYDTIYIEVLNNPTYSFTTHDNPCKNVGYGFSLYAPDTMESVLPYVIRTDRDTLEYGLLKFSIDNPILVKN